MLRFLKYWLPVILWMGLIFGLSTNLGSTANTSRILVPLLRWLYPTMSFRTIVHVHSIIRKVGHLGEYAVLGMLLWRALRQARLRDAGSSFWRVAVAVLLISAAYAATDEFHQSFLPTRTPSVRDVMIDTCGSLIGLSIIGAGTACRRMTTGWGWRSGRPIQQ
jgi:VanZ family protein